MTAYGRTGQERARPSLLGESPTGPSLRSQQAWFANAVTTPESESAPQGADHAEKYLTAGPSMDARDRLEIYRRAYHARLIECLLDDYPALRAAMGEAPFDALCRAYIAQVPSQGPSLNSFGRSMAPFCRDALLLPSVVRACPRAFLADLASLEWAMVEVIHAPGAEPFTLEGMGEVPAVRWATARLVTTPALRLVCSEYPVNAFYQAFREGRDPALPEAASSATVVYRCGPTVWRMDLTHPMFELLRMLASGENLSVALERAAGAFADTTEEVAVQRVTAWFRDWVASGLFAGIEMA